MTTPNRLAVIITALQIEREAVLEHLHDVTDEPPLRGSLYRRGVFDEKSDPWDIVVAEIGTGNEGAAAEAERILGHYNPDVAMFVGIAGALKDLSRGDVVASTKIYNYEAGKDAPTAFLTRPETELSAHALLSRARHEAVNGAGWREFERPGQSWCRRPVSEPRLGRSPPDRKYWQRLGRPRLTSSRSITVTLSRLRWKDMVSCEACA